MPLGRFSIVLLALLLATPAGAGRKMQPSRRGNAGAGKTNKTGPSYRRSQVPTRRTSRLRAKSVRRVRLPAGADLLSPTFRERVENLWAAHASGSAVRRVIRRFLNSSAVVAVSSSDDDGELMGKLMDDMPPIAGRSRRISKLKVAALEFETGPKHRVKKPMQWIRSAVNRGADVVIAPEWFFVPKGRFYSEREYRTLVKKLRETSKGFSGLIVPGTIAWKDGEGNYRNTALALSNGRILKEYDKRHDGDDHSFASRRGIRWKAGGTDSLFTWRGLRVGLEVCRDHRVAGLLWDLTERGQPMVDLQLVVSAGVPVSHTAVGVGGIVVLAQGARDPGGGGLGGHLARRLPAAHGEGTVLRDGKRVDSRPLGKGRLSILEL